MAAAVRLMEAGADLADITDAAMNHKPLSAMRLWGLALSVAKLRGQVLWVANHAGDARQLGRRR